MTHLFNNSLKTKMKNDGSGMWNGIESNGMKLKPAFWWDGDEAWNQI